MWKLNFFQPSTNTEQCLFHHRTPNSTWKAFNNENIFLISCFVVMKMKTAVETSEKPAVSKFDFAMKTKALKKGWKIERNEWKSFSWNLWVWKRVETMCFFRTFSSRLSLDILCYWTKKKFRWISHSLYLYYSLMPHAPDSLIQPLSSSLFNTLHHHIFRSFKVPRKRFSSFPIRIFKGAKLQKPEYRISNLVSAIIRSPDCTNACYTIHSIIHNFSKL